MNTEYLFIQDIKLLTPEDYKYGNDHTKDLQLARSVFYAHDVCVNKLDVDTFEVYRNDEKNKLIVGFLAGVGIYESSRSRHIQENVQIIAEIFSKGCGDYDLTYIVVHVQNHLSARGVLTVGSITDKEEDHLNAVLQEEVVMFGGHQPQHSTNDVSRYGRVMEVSCW